MSDQAAPSKSFKRLRPPISPRRMVEGVVVNLYPDLLRREEAQDATIRALNSQVEALALVIRMQRRQLQEMREQLRHVREELGYAEPVDAELADAD